MAAAITTPLVATEGGCAAAYDVGQNAVLLRGEHPRVTLEKLASVLSEDVGHLRPKLALHVFVACFTASRRSLSRAVWRSFLVATWR